MKKDELLALGLTVEQIRTIQELSGRDREKMKVRLGNAKDNGVIREAIISSVKAISSADSLKKILCVVSDEIIKEHTEEEQRELENKDNISG